MTERTFLGYYKSRRRTTKRPSSLKLRYARKSGSLLKAGYYPGFISGYGIKVPTALVTAVEANTAIAAIAQLKQAKLMNLADLIHSKTIHGLDSTTLKEQHDALAQINPTDIYTDAKKRYNVSHRGQSEMSADILTRLSLLERLLPVVNG